MANPVLVRDSFDARRWHAYIPADNQGHYWARWTFGPPNDTSVTYFFIHQLFYGIVRPGKRVAAPADGSSDDWAETGVWSAVSAGAWAYRQTTAQNAYVDVTIPAGYNRIGIIAYEVNANAGTLGVSWDDDSTTGLDVTSINLADGTTAMTEVVVAANASPDGTKKLRLKKTDAGAGAVRIVGVRSWDTDGIGDPSTAVSDIAVGHDLVDGFSCTGNQGHNPTVAAGVDASVLGICVVTPSGNANEFAIKTGPDGGTVKFTGGPAHFGSGQASYTYHSGEFATGPTIYVDGVAADEVWDDANKPKGSLITGGCIYIHSRGFGDWDEGGDEDAAEPHFSIDYIITPNGLQTAIVLTFQGDTDVDTTYAYGPMLYIGATNYAAKLSRSLPDETQTSGLVTYAGASECELILPDNNNQYVAVKLEAVPPLQQFYFESNKLYSRVKVESMPGGANPTAGEVWTMGGRYTVRRVRKIRKLTDRRMRSMVLYASESEAAHDY